MLGLPIIGRNSVSFGYGGFGGIVPDVVVCLTGDVGDDAAASGAVGVEGLVSGAVQTNLPAITGDVQIDAAITGEVQTEAQVGGPVLQSC